MINYVEISKLLEENANTQIDKCVWELCGRLEDFEKEKIRLEAENQQMTNTISTLQNVIDLLVINQRKGE